MNSIYPIEKDKKFSKQLLISGVTVIVFEILVTIYSILGLFALVPISVPIFILLLMILVLVNTQMLVLVGKNIDKIGVRTVIVLIVWLGLVVGFWIFAPIYY